MKLLLTLITLFSISFCFAQRQNIYFLKDNGKYVSVRDSADYVRIVREPDSASMLYNIFEFYLNNKPKLVGKSSKIDPPNFEGQCITFYKNDAKRSLANYKDGRITGLEYDFYPNGKSYLVKEYPDNKDPNNDFSDNYLIMDNRDSLGKVLVADGNGYFKGYDNKFKYIDEEGPVKNGKRDGAWKGAFWDMKTSFTENYENGLLITGTAIDSAGTGTTYTKSRSIPPQFSGGLDAFYKYLSKNIHYPSYEREHDIQGIVIASFVVEKDGKLKDIKINKSVNSSLDYEAIRVLKRSPLWIPGTMFGKPVRAFYSIPIQFSLTD